MPPFTKGLFGLTIDEWANNFWELYKNENEGKSVPEIWLAVIRFASKIAEGIRKGEYWEAKKALAHTFCWLCVFTAFCNRTIPKRSSFYLGASLSSIVAFKFPGVCGRCCNCPCTCGSNRIFLESIDEKSIPGKLENFRSTFYCSKYTVDTWTLMFVNIFGNALYFASLEGICLHLMEEIGEVAKAVEDLAEFERLLTNRKMDRPSEAEEERKKNLKGEIADTFSWLNGLSIKLGFLVTGIEEKLPYKARTDAVKHFLLNCIIAEYRDPQKSKRIKCPECGDNPCRCRGSENPPSPSAQQCTGNPSLYLV